MKPGTFCIKPKKSAAPSQAECAEQRQKVSNPSRRRHETRVLCNSPSNCCIPSTVPTRHRLLHLLRKMCGILPASLLHPFRSTNAMHISILHVRRAKQGAERGREGGRTGGHLSESAASLAQATDATPPSSSSPLPLANIDTRDAGNSQVSPLFSLQ